MKDIYETILNHRSIRKYKNQDIPDEDLKKILNSALRAPTSINGQQCSVIVIKNKDNKKKLAHLAGDQPWIEEAPVFLVFVSDFSRVAKAMIQRNIDFENISSVESTLVGAVDCGIAFGSMMNLAESMGYGIVPIGAIRKNPKEVIELLQLPMYVYPIVGMCIGVPDEMPDIKPRFNFDTIIHEEVYRPITNEELKTYDDTILEYMTKRTGGKDVRSWSDLVTRVYSNVYFPEVNPTLCSQGYTNEK